LELPSRASCFHPKIITCISQVNFVTLAVACKSDTVSSVYTGEADKGAANCAAKVIVGESPTALRVKGTAAEVFGLTPKGTAETAMMVAAENRLHVRQKTEPVWRSRSANRNESPQGLKPLMEEALCWSLSLHLGEIDEAKDN
jgi:hypothetical protein